MDPSAQSHAMTIDWNTHCGRNVAELQNWQKLLAPQEGHEDALTALRHVITGGDHGLLLVRRRPLGLLGAQEVAAPPQPSVRPCLACAGQPALLGLPIRFKQEATI
jgi:hypothetical protein